MLLRDFQLRDAEVAGDGRNVLLACVPFDTPAYVDDGAGPYREGFRRGAFRHIVRAANRVELRYSHRRDGMPYGFGVRLTEDPKYLFGEFRVAPSDSGDQALALVRDGQLSGVSIGFVAGEDDPGVDQDGPITWRTLVRQLLEVSLTPVPSYAGAHVVGLRESAAIPPDRRAAARAWIELQRLRMG